MTGWQKAKVINLQVFNTKLSLFNQASTQFSLIKMKAIKITAFQGLVVKLL